MLHTTVTKHVAPHLNIQACIAPYAPPHASSPINVHRHGAPWRGRTCAHISTRRLMACGLVAQSSADLPEGPPLGTHTHTRARLGDECSARKRLGDAISKDRDRGLSPVRPSSKASVSSWLPSEVRSLRASERACDLRGEAGGAAGLLLAVAVMLSAWTPPLALSVFFRAFL